MRFDVSTTAGLCASALIVPISGIVIWKSESTSSRNASNSSSARSISSISKTTFSGRLDRLEQRPPDEELRPEQLLLRHRAFLCRADVEQLARVVPLVDGVRDVEALVALKPDQPRAEDARECLGRLRLPDARLALEQQRLLERQREEERGRETAVGEVARALEDHLRARLSNRTPSLNCTRAGKRARCGAPLRPAAVATGRRSCSSGRSRPASCRSSAGRRPARCRCSSRRGCRRR